MSGDKLVVDTNIIIYHLNGDKTIELLLMGKKLAVSFISEIELNSYPDLSNQQREVIQYFLSLTEIVHSNSYIVAEAVKIRIGKKLKTPDAIIAATALVLNLPLLSADKRLAGTSGLDLITYTPAN
ncbi:MAG: type II toxin-antitoxin system VapC family toxin [Bacteroidetes bacterium]|nr:type II toxin-antitoxin system VapC family toxin [Bacteroidota bacterium]